MSVMTSSCVGPTQKSRSWRSLKRSSSGPNLSHLPDSTHSSAGMAAGIRTSSAPARSISSRTMFSTLRMVRRPRGIQVYRPAASLRMRPARSMSWWLTTSASAGVSLVVLTGYWDQRIGARECIRSRDSPMMPAVSDEPAKSVNTPSRGIYLLPNLFTTGCLFSGFYSIVAAIDRNFAVAGGAIFIAILFDGLDGRVARWTRTESQFGKEYDSLADMVAFGLAPAVLVYQWGVVRIGEYGHEWRQFGWIIAFFYSLCAALRLARFNVVTATGDKRFFQGLASPSAAATRSEKHTS